MIRIKEQNNMTSIFNEENAQSGGNFFTFKQVGDMIEGTLIGKKNTINRMYGNPQIIYKIKTAAGEIWNIGGKPGIDMQMTNIKLGQIVGFKFTKITPPSKPGYKPANIIQVYANPNAVDKEWLQEEEEADSEVPQNTVIQKGEVEEESLKEMIANAKEVPFQDKGEVSKMLTCILQLAKDKLGAVTADDSKQKVMEATGLYFSEPNYLNIIEKLSDLPTKKA